jgi:hypothetical protein
MVVGNARSTNFPAIKCDFFMDKAVVGFPRAEKCHANFNEARFQRENDGGNRPAEIHE